MSRFFPNAVRSFTSFFGVDGLRFSRLTVRSHSALGAEILFLRKQLAFYEERETQPRRLNDAARLSLMFWSRLFDWKTALVIVKPETLIGWHRQGFKLFWRWKSRAGRAFPRAVGVGCICVNHRFGNKRQDQPSTTPCCGTFSSSHRVFRVLLKVVHAPAGATTLLIWLGLITIRTRSSNGHGAGIAMK